MLFSRVVRTEFYELSVDAMINGPIELRCSAVAEFLRAVSECRSLTADEAARISYFIGELLACEDLLPRLRSLCRDTAGRIARTGSA